MAYLTSDEDFETVLDVELRYKCGYEGGEVAVLIYFDIRYVWEPGQKGEKITKFIEHNFPEVYQKIESECLKFVDEEWVRSRRVI
jgi:hypothetical protein